MWKKKFVYVSRYLKTFKAVQKNNPRTHSLQQNKKAVLKTAGYFNVLLGRRDNYCSLFIFVYQKGCFWSKTEKVNSATEYFIFKLVYNISHKLLRPSQFLEKFMEILEWSTLQK